MLPRSWPQTNPVDLADQLQLQGEVTLEFAWHGNRSASSRWMATRLDAMSDKPMNNAASVATTWGHRVMLPLHWHPTHCHWKSHPANQHLCSWTKDPELLNPLRTAKALFLVGLHLASLSLPCIPIPLVLVLDLTLIPNDQQHLDHDSNIEVEHLQSHPDPSWVVPFPKDTFAFWWILVDQKIPSTEPLVFCQYEVSSPSRGPIKNLGRKWSQPTKGPKLYIDFLRLRKAEEDVFREKQQ